MTDTPTPTDDFHHHCREIVRRFLLTAVVVDDELAISTDPPVHDELKPPNGSPAAKRKSESANGDHHPSRPIRVDHITWAFARQGMVCGVVSPHNGHDNGSLAKCVGRADIVILDWLLNRETGGNALPLLERILKEDRAHRLRLIAFYTGESPGEIRETIKGALDQLDLPDRSLSNDGDASDDFDFGPCRIVVYAKPDSRTLEGIIVKEEDLAERLIADFAGMVDGLLPSLVLTALAAVRRNVHRVLDRFGRDLDPAYLAHRACLPQPVESEQHMVAQIASELHGIMEDAVGASNPAGMQAIERWLADRFGDRQVEFSPEHKASVGDVAGALERGLQEPPRLLSPKKHHLLSLGFSQGVDKTRRLDRRLASAMSFRQVLEDVDRQLSMGTVVERMVVDHPRQESQTLLCVTPRCDSVRLTGDSSSFLFLPLTDPKPNTAQVVVPTSDDEYRRMTISTNPSHWSMAKFPPDPERQCVLAHSDEPDRPWTFTDTGGTKYRWIGELKPEFAQSIAQAIAERMARMPLDKSEWLRRSEAVGPR